LAEKILLLQFDAFRRYSSLMVVAFVFGINLVETNYFSVVSVEHLAFLFCV